MRTCMISVTAVTLTVRRRLEERCTRSIRLKATPKLRSLSRTGTSLFVYFNRLQKNKKIKQKLFMADHQTTSSLILLLLMPSTWYFRSMSACKSGHKTGHVHARLHTPAGVLHVLHWQQYIFIFLAHPQTAFAFPNSPPLSTPLCAGRHLKVKPKTFLSTGETRYVRRRFVLTARQQSVREARAHCAKAVGLSQKGTYLAVAQWLGSTAVATVCAGFVKYWPSWL